MLNGVVCVFTVVASSRNVHGFLYLCAALAIQWLCIETSNLRDVPDHYRDNRISCCVTVHLQWFNEWTRFEWKWVLHFQIKNHVLPSQEKRLLPVCEDMKSARSCTRETAVWIPGSMESQLLYSKDTVWERQANGTVIYNKSCGYFEIGFEGARVKCCSWPLE